MSVNERRSDRRADRIFLSGFENLCKTQTKEKIQIFRSVSRSNPRPSFDQLEAIDSVEVFRGTFDLSAPYQAADRAKKLRL